jgi:hypothetical protein
MREAKVVAAIVSMAALVTVAVCALLIVRRQNTIASLARTEACYSRAQATSAEITALSGRIPWGNTYNANAANDLVERTTNACRGTGLPSVPPPTAPTSTTTSASTLPECLFPGQQTRCR